MLNNLFSAKKKYSRAQNISIRHVKFSLRNFTLELCVLQVFSGSEATEPLLAPAPSCSHRHL